jgi:adhesin HecA-like repeat protein
MQVTLITGASGGIGEEVAWKLAERKNNLLLVARNAEKLAQLCKKIKSQFKVQAQFISADLSKPEAPQYIYEEIRRMGLEVGTLINNAGIGSGGAFTELSLQSELDLVQLNIASLIAVTHLFLKDMQRKRSGVVINVASMTAFMPVPYMATYAASKMFVRSFTEAITQEAMPFGVHVMLFCPGLTKTNFNAAAGIDNRRGKGLSSDYENADWQTPEQVAKELISALEQRKHFAVSGTKNRMGAKILALLPNFMIAKQLARRYQKKTAQQ